MNNRQLTTNNRQQKIIDVNSRKLSVVCCKLKSGQAMLIALMMIFVATIAIGIASATIAITQIGATQNQKIASAAYNLAASGIENTFIRMTRSDFSTPPPISLNNGTEVCTISIAALGGANPTYRVDSVAEINNPLGGGKKVTKKLQAMVSIVSGVTTLISLGETY